MNSKTQSTKNTKARHQKDSGTTTRFNWYKAFVLILSISELVVNYFSLQSVGGESIANWALIPITIAISLCMMFAGHYTGESLGRHSVKRRHSVKGLAMAILLSALFLFIIVYLRGISGASFILSLANVGFYGTVVYVSFLRAKDQILFDLEDNVKQLTIEDARLNAATEVIQSNYSAVKDTKVSESRAYATDTVESQEESLRNGISDADGILEMADQYEARRTQETNDIELGGLNSCLKN